ncbi:hypothetical protein HX109_00985 [Galbibacter sp. BG1]|uniref:hypothetical protein n=1 Tax=Galbibacter sp. BG1 TaxID=1170699 RepID=UPI0015BB6DF8|nr:hypothetical protein [Galbibacter sp. BG1]QLE00204.1 hypothetical protein HX109_00985 [Galbibacter sp. BG1]
MKKENNKKLSHFDKEKLNDGFSADSLYFDELEASILEKLDLEESLLDTKVDGMHPDDDYFDTLEADILQQVQNEPKRTRVLSLFREYWQVAAVIAVCLSSVLIYMNEKATKKQDASIAGLYEELSTPYVEQNIYFFNDAEMEVLLEDAIFEIEDDFELDPEDLEEYLLINEAYNYQ